jgi:hypothetical protein
VNIKFHYPTKGDRFIINKSCVVKQLSSHQLSYAYSRAEDSVSVKLKLNAGDEIIICNDFYEALYGFLKVIVLNKTIQLARHHNIRCKDLNLIDATLIKQNQKISLQAISSEINPKIKERISTSKKSKVIKETFIQYLQDVREGSNLLLKASLYEMLHHVNAKHISKYKYVKGYDIDKLTRFKSWYGYTKIADGKFSSKFRFSIDDKVMWLFEGEIDDEHNITNTVLLPLPF